MKEELQNKLNQISESIEVKNSHITSEILTISALVNPFLMAMGYDITNPSEVIREYDADSRLKKGNKVDIAIIQDGKPIIFIECKKLGEDLDKHIGQLNSYFVSVPDLCFAILTNGSEYRFYKETDKTRNVMDLKPFLQFDLTKRISPSQLHTLSKFHQEEFNYQELSKSIENLETENSIKNFMMNLISDELYSEEEFLHLLKKRTPYKFKKGENKENFPILVSKIIKNWIEDIVRERINDMLRKQKESEESNISMSNHDIITTDEEIEAYHIVKAICTEKIPPEKIQFQDYLGFFSIYYDGKKTKHICKLYLTDKKKEIEIFDRENLVSLDDLYSFKAKLFQKIDNLSS